MNICSGRTQIIQWGIYILICLFLVAGCVENGTTVEETSQPEVEENAQPYFGLEFPGNTVTRFAPLIFRQEMHAPPIFTPDGKEVYWSLMGDPGGVRYMEIENGAWTDPAPAPFDRRKGGDSPFITSDGNHLLFLSWSMSGEETIHQVDRVDGEWGSPQQLPDEINQNGAHWQASMADNGDLYFGSGGQIYFARFLDGAYLEAEVMDLASDLGGGYAGSPFIAPDGSYLIFDVAGGTDADLYITFNNEEGEWDDPVLMEALNSSAHDLYANVSPDGRFLMFLSGRSGILLPYWVDGIIIEEIRLSRGEGE